MRFPRFEYSHILNSTLQITTSTLPEYDIPATYHSCFVISAKTKIKQRLKIDFISSLFITFPRPQDGNCISESLRIKNKPGKHVAPIQCFFSFLLFRVLRFTCHQ